MKILALGPFMGDWENEICNFYPYVKWLCEVIKYDDVFISTHSNRLFLYDWIENTNSLNVFENLSRDEFSQIGATHKNISQEDYTLIYKKFKNDVSRYSISGKKNIEVYNIQYTPQNIFYPYHNKIYSKIAVDSEKNKKNIVYIPDIREDKRVIHEIYNQLIKKYKNVVVIGDMKTHLSDHNIILKHSDYFQNGYKYILKEMMDAKAVICPLGHWSLLCNIQQIPVFSWGIPSGLYGGSMYNLENRNCKNYRYDISMTPEKLVNMFNFFLENIKK